MFNRETIRQAAAPKTTVVEIPEWGGSIMIRQLSGDVLLRLIKADKHKAEDDKRGMAESIVASAVNEDGTTMYAESDIPEVESYSFAGLIRLSTEINKFNGLGEDTAKN